MDGAEHPPPGLKPSALLAALVVHANRRVAVSTLLEVVWAGRPPAKAEGTLESHVWRLRRLLEPGRGRGEAPGVLVNDSGGYRLLARADQVDSARFEHLADETRALATDGEPADVLARCDEALALWRGTPYEQIAAQEWIVPFLVRLEEIAAELRERRIDALLGTGATDRALSDVARLIEETPYRERLWAQRMIGLYRTGRAEEALQAYQRARTRLLDELGTEPGTELREVHRRVLAQDPALAPAPPPVTVRPSRSATVPAAHLPARAEPLIGRATDLQALTDLVRTRRLVTVTGAAGCGKTRLAVEVAAAVVEAFPDGAWFVDLTAVDRPELVVDVLTTTLGLAAPVSGSAGDALRDHLRDRRMLVVLDNAEHLLDAVAEVVGEVQAGAGQCVLLVTSREPVAVPGEVVWPLGPLPLTASADPLAADPEEGPGRSPALELFLARLGSADPTLTVDDDVVVVAERICEALDGVPLALELAAARVRSATLTEIADQVSADASGLRRLGRAGADHRQSVRAAIEWSHRLLSPQEQAVHRRLSVLPGPITRSAATAVAAADPVEAADVPELLALLTHRSLLHPVRLGRAPGPSLFSQLATVRGHAAHSLAAHDETAAAVRRRDTWVASLLAGRPRLSAAGGDWYDAVADAYATVRATLQHLLVEAPDPTAGRLLSHLSMFWYYRERTVEAGRWLRLALELPGLDPADTASAHLTLLGHELLRGRSDLSLPHLDAALAPIGAASTDRLVDLAELMATCALAAHTRQADDQAARLVVAVAGIADTTGDREVRLLADALALLTAAPQRTGTPSAAAADVHEQARAEGNPLVAWVAATAATAQADTPGDALRWWDRVAEAVLLVGSRDVGIWAEVRAGLMVSAGQHREAVRLFAAARRELRRSGLTWPMNPATRDLMREARGALGPGEFDRSWHDGERQLGPALLPGLVG
nr:BTAD domain-containing putative transcriptional regulator [Modestobacter versicolor]